MLLSNSGLGFNLLRKLLSLMVLASFSTAAAMAADSLCTANEKILFSCALPGQLLSVCASADISPTRGYLQLRVGQAGHLLAAWPEAEHPPKGVTKGGLIADGRLGQYVRFVVDSEAYVVFSLPGEASGLVMLVDGKVRGKNYCHSLGEDHLEDSPVPVSQVFAVSGIARR